MAGKSGTTLVPAFCIAALLMLSGCASQVPALTEELGRQTGCCAALAELSFEAIPDDQELRFSIGPGDQVFDFPSGKSFLKAFELPGEQQIDSLQIRTYLVGSYVDSAHVFAPFVHFLDSVRTPIGSEMLLPLEPDGGFLGLSGGSRWKGMAKIPDGARYVVIFTKPTWIQGQRFFIGSTSANLFMSGRTPIYIPSSGPRSVPYGPGGDLSIRLMR